MDLPPRHDPGGLFPSPTHREPKPTAMSVGVEPVPNVRTTSRVDGSILEIVLSSASITQTDPSPTATFDGVVPSATRPVTRPVAGSSTMATAASGASPRHGRPSHEDACDEGDHHEGTHDDVIALRPGRAGTTGDTGRDSAGAGGSSSGSCSRIRRSQRLQGPARLETQLLRKDPSTLLVHLQRLSLASRTVQRQHALCAQSLPERVGLDEPLQLHDKGRVPPAREVCLDTLLERREPELLQTRDLRLGEGLICELRQGWTSPRARGLREAWSRHARDHLPRVPSFPLRQAPQTASSRARPAGLRSSSR